MGRLGRWSSDTVPIRRIEPSLGDLSDSLLVREARSGNHGAYGELVRRHQDRIFTVVLGQIQNREDAVDLTQEVFVRAHTKLDTFREDALFYTWLYRITLNVCLDFRRRRCRAPEPFSLDHLLPDQVGYDLPDDRAQFDPGLALENKELGAFLRACIQALSEPLRIAVILHDVEGLPQKDIARILKCPLGTVKSRIQRGRIELRQKLAPFLSGQSPDDLS